MAEMTEKDVWTLIEEAPEYATATADLYHWSTNYGAGKGPITLFLDLIGWSYDNIGESLYQLGDASGLGYVELSKLADALKEYTDRPQDVTAFVSRLLEAEAAE